MTEHQAEELSKFIIDHGNDQFTAFEKEIIKKAVDEASLQQN